MALHDALIFRPDDVDLTRSPLRRGIDEQVQILLRMRKSLARAYDVGRKDFKATIKTLDAANSRLEQTMEMLRGMTVERVFRPDGEEPRNLMDFVDENEVEKLRNGLKESIQELQVRFMTSYYPLVPDSITPLTPPLPIPIRFP